jgi:hypothetical protein
MTKLGQLKRSYYQMLDNAEKEIQAKFIDELEELRKVCIHKAGSVHRTGIGTKVTFCSNCGAVIDESIV